MAFQSQTYGNSNNGYYVKNETPINPNDPTALLSPVEFLFNSTIQGAYYGEITQGISSFTISEKKTAGLSTISFLTMDAVRPVVQMAVVDLNNQYLEPVIQQWGTISSIVNGVFKIGSKSNINDDSTAYQFANNPVQTTQRQGNLIQITNLPNNRTRFSNLNDDFSYTEINQTVSNPTVSVVNLLGQTKVTISTISFSDFTTSPSQIAKIGTKSTAPNSFLIESASDTQIRTSLNNLQTATFNANGTTTLLSTLTVPSIVNTEISTLRVNQGGAIGVPVSVNGSLRLKTEIGPNGAAGINYLQSPRVRFQDTFVSPKVFYPAGNSESQIIQNTLQGTFGAPVTASNSMEFINNSQNTSGGFQYFHAQDGNTSTPEWLGGLTYNPKEFRLASTVTASLPNITNTQTASILQLTNVSTINGLDIKTFIEPPGMMVPYAPYAPNAPTGWLICDGKSYSQAAYLTLYNLIGLTYGGGGGNFNVPDMRGRASYGTVASATNSGPSGAQTINVNAIGFQILTVPTALLPFIPTFQGQAYGYLCNSANGPLYKNMQSITSNYPGTLFFIIPIPNTTQFIIVTEPFAGAQPTIFPMSLAFQFNIDSQTTSAPSVYNSASINPAVGEGQTYISLIEAEVPSHVHGGTPNTSAGLYVAGGVEGGRANNSGANSGLWSYTSQTSGLNGYGASANQYIPPNVATWFIIKT